MINIEEKFKERFPNDTIVIETKIQRVAKVSSKILFSPEFSRFLDDIAYQMTDEEYMGTDFMIKDIE